MAVTQAPASDHPDMDYVEHEKTYAMFISMAKWGCISVLGVIILLAFLTL